MLRKKTVKIMKKIICIALLLVVLAVGVFAGCTPSPVEADGIKNVILVIGDGMGLQHVEAGQLANDKTFPFASWQSVLVDTNCLNGDGTAASKTTDSAAAATALASGALTYTGFVGKDSKLNDVKTILDIAREHGKKTGIVTTDKLYGATPAGFSAHSMSRNSTKEIITTQLQSDVNLLCATSSDTVATYSKQFAENGYQYCDNYDNRNNINGEKALCLFDLEGYGSSVPLCDATKFALDYLDNDKGFVLIVEQAHVDKKSHDNDFEGMTRAANSLNDTVETITSWVGNRNDTAVLVTADHETGGLSVSKTATDGTEFTTAGGNTMYYHWTSTSHTDSKVGLFYFGFTLDSAKLPYFGKADLIKNSDIFVIMDALVR